ncbi:hypothetical protein GCM10017764_14310 [Sphingobacterium griseoflavum]|uniref:SMODS and SLOG-associating 2TM effector domain-containing protein n=1 Tax=Sphingobacterium griseoflavum TaxID=1474952 RepID=A0ABQ3HYL9_9SPHI|nr:hypothetical protein GCM10017764_14310 [Sphingobacterium griseoflavum]
MDKERTGDIFFSRIMAKGKLTIPNDHFENELLNRIKHENWKNKCFAKHRILSILCFVACISIGSWKFDLLMESLQYTFNIPFSSIVLTAQIFFVVFILFQINSILTLIFKH